MDTDEELNPSSPQQRFTCLKAFYHILSDLACSCSPASPAASLLPPVQPSEAPQPRAEELKKKKKLSKKTVKLLVIMSFGKQKKNCKFFSVMRVLKIKEL